MTILEALAYGCPCMVTPMTNMAELIQENHCGWIIDLTANSIVSSIKKAYLELTDNPNKYYNNCRNTAKLYSWDNIANASIEFYQNVIENNG